MSDGLFDVNPPLRIPGPEWLEWLIYQDLGLDAYLAAQEIADREWERRQ